MTSNTPDFSRVRRYLDSLTDAEVPGNDCIISLGGEVVFRHISGYADSESKTPLTEESIYLLWSLSKVITTSLAMRLYEEGRFRMTDPIYEYLPEFRDMQVRCGDGNETKKAENPILVKHLFNMTAGFNYNFSAAPIVEARKAFDKRCPTREIVRAIAKCALSFEPGEHFKYGMSHEILGALIEVVSGKKLRDYAKEVLFDPLGMYSTCYNLPSPDKMSRMATLYNYREDRKIRTRTNNTCAHILGCDYDSGGAGVISSAEDYMKFTMVLANGGTSNDGYRYLSPETVKLWKTNTLSPESVGDMRNQFKLDGYGYGYGVRTMLEPESVNSAAPIGEFGWSGAAGAWAMIDTDRKLSAVYFQHMLFSREPETSPILRELIYSSL